MRVIIALAALVSLGACSTMRSITSPKPVSIGGGANSLKRTPCAGCVPKGQKPGLPEFLQDGYKGTPA